MPKTHTKIVAAGTAAILFTLALNLALLVACIAVIVVVLRALGVIA
jgi:hypothetical protein